MLTTKKTKKKSQKSLDSFNVQLRTLKKKIMQKPYYENSSFVLYNDDSLKVLEKLPENSIDMIFADPPYNLSNGGSAFTLGKWLV